MAKMCWTESREGPQRCSEGWSTSAMGEAGRVQAVQPRRGEGSGETLEHLPVPKGALQESWKEDSNIGTVLTLKKSEQI